MLPRPCYTCIAALLLSESSVTVGNVNTSDVQKYIEEQESHHKKDNFAISEF